MTHDFTRMPEDAPPGPRPLERIKALSTGTILVLAGGFLLFFDLFLTWQELKVDFGRAGTATLMLDGWDVWGVLIGFAILGLLGLVIVVEVTDVEVSTEVPWELLAFVLALTIVGLTVVKNLTDANSAWPSYAGIVLASLIAIGAGLNWARARSARA